MDGTLGWRTRHDQLGEQVRSAGTLLADRTMPEPQRQQISNEFVRAWQQFCENVKQHPTNLEGA